MTQAELLEQAVRALSVAWGSSIEETLLRLSGDHRGAAVSCRVDQDGGVLVASCSDGDWACARGAGYPIEVDWRAHARAEHNDRPWVR